MVLTIEGRDTLDEGPTEGLFAGGSIDFRAEVGAVVVPETDLPERADKPSCFVGDLVGDLNQSV